MKYMTHKLIILFLLSFAQVSLGSVAAGLDLSIDSTSSQALFRDYAQSLVEGITDEDATSFGDVVEELAQTIEDDQSVVIALFKLMQRLGVSSGGRFQHTPDDGAIYGYSFIDKNLAATQLVSAVLKGEKHLSPDHIKENSVVIADLGSGLGVSAFLMMFDVIQGYQAKRWVLKAPLQLDLCDLIPKNVEALHRLGTMITRAYPQYVKVRSCLHDLTKDRLEASRYQIILSLNVLHYIPKETWPVVLDNMHQSLMERGLLLITTDHASRTFVGPAPLQPFHHACFVIFDKDAGVSTGTQIKNIENVSLFLECKDVTIGNTVPKDHIDYVKLRRLLFQHQRQLDKTSSRIFRKVSGKIEAREVSLEHLIRFIEKGSFQVYSGNYVFDDERLAACVCEKSKGFEVVGDDDLRLVSPEVYFAAVVLRRSASKVQPPRLLVTDGSNIPPGHAHCKSCQKIKKKDLFSKAQLKKKFDERRCQACTSAL